METKRGTWGAIAAAGVLAGAAALSVAAAGRAWDRETRRRVDALYRGALAGGARAFDPAELDGVPAPVARYFRFALGPGQPLVRTARVTHRGTFRGSLDAAWSAFTSVQHFSAVPAGFVWDARIRMGPGIPVRVRDFYLGGRAGMLARLAALVPLVRQEGTAALASGALHRQLAERVWLPTALLPSQGVSWDAVSDSTARATLTDAGFTVAMDVHFGAEGGIERVEMMRMRDVGGVGVPTPFEGRFGDYQRIGGMMIPREAEVTWVLPEGRLTYWRGRITGAEYAPHA